jgi:hypothetical protein
MIRQIGILTLSAALAVPAVWAQRGERKTIDLSRKAGRVTTVEQPSASSVRLKARINTRNLKAGTKSAGAATAELVQAPGVVQLNLFESYNSGREAYFVATNYIPSGSTIQAFIILPDNTELDLEVVQFNYEISPGESFVLPDIKKTGFFWKYGLTNIGIEVTTPDGSKSVSIVDFPTADWQGSYYRNIDDVALMVPGITSYREYVEDGVLKVEIKGRFLSSSKPLVVFEDLVAPPSSISTPDNSTIIVDTTKLIGYYWDPSDPNADSNGMVKRTFDPTVMKGYLLTVGQVGYTDTLPFRHTPQ